MRMVIIKNGQLKESGTEDCFVLCYNNLGCPCDIKCAAYETTDFCRLTTTLKDTPVRQYARCNFAKCMIGVF